MATLDLAICRSDHVSKTAENACRWRKNSPEQLWEWRIRLFLNTRWIPRNRSISSKKTPELTNFRIANKFPILCSTRIINRRFFFSLDRERKRGERSLTYSGHFTGSTMLVLLDVLNNLQSFSPFLSARVAPTKEENFGCSVKYEYIIVVQGWPRKRHLLGMLTFKTIFTKIQTGLGHMQVHIYW